MRSHILKAAIPPPHIIKATIRSIYIYIFLYASIFDSQKNLFISICLTTKHEITRRLQKSTNWIFWHLKPVYLEIISYIYCLIPERPKLFAPFSCLKGDSNLMNGEYIREALNTEGSWQKLFFCLFLICEIKYHLMISK